MKNTISIYDPHSIFSIYRFGFLVLYKRGVPWTCIKAVSGALSAQT